MSEWQDLRSALFSRSHPNFTKKRKSDCAVFQPKTKSHSCQTLPCVSPWRPQLPMKTASWQTLKACSARCKQRWMNFKLACKTTRTRLNRSVHLNCRKRKASPRIYGPEWEDACLPSSMWFWIRQPLSRIPVIWRCPMTSRKKSSAISTLRLSTRANLSTGTTRWSTSWPKPLRKSQMSYLADRWLC